MAPAPYLSKIVEAATRSKATPTLNRMRRMLVADLSSRGIQPETPEYRRATDTLGAFGHKHVMASVASELLWQTANASAAPCDLSPLLQAASDRSERLPADLLPLVFAFETYVLQARAEIDCFWVHVREVLELPSNGGHRRLKADLASIAGPLASRAARLRAFAFPDDAEPEWTKMLIELRDPVAHRDKSRPLFETEPQPLQLLTRWPSLAGKTLQEVAQFFQNRVFEDLIREAAASLYGRAWPAAEEADFRCG